MSTVAKTRTFEGNAEALERHPPPRGARVLDVGCGFGDSTLEIAERVGPGGEAVGVDAAARFIDVATAEAATAGVDNARFLVADAQREALEGPYDYAFSRFGTMFFENPVAAMRNVRNSLKQGGVLTMTVWRRKDENPWLCSAEQAVAPIVPLPPSSDEPTCGPGPFSMASADLVSAQLLAAGFADVAFERFDTSICIGASVADARDFAMALGPAGEIIRLAGAAGERCRPQVTAALMRLFGPLARPDGVYAGASTWIVTARARTVT